MNLKLANEQGYLPSLDLNNLDLETLKKLGLDVGDREFSGKLKRKDYGELTRNVRQKLAVLEPVPKAFEPKPVVEVSNYDIIQDVILGARKVDFQNPGVMDDYVLPNQTLREMLMGKSESFSKAAAVLQDLVKPETQDVSNLFC